MTTKPTADLEKYINFLISPEAKEMPDSTRLENLIVAVTELLEQKPTAEVSVEEIKRRYNQMWDNGEFEWNHHEGDVLGKKPISPERIWNVSILPLLHSHTTALKAKVEEELEGKILPQDEEWKVGHNIGIKEALQAITNIT